MFFLFKLGVKSFTLVVFCSLLRSPRVLGQGSFGKVFLVRKVQVGRFFELVRTFQSNVIFQCNLPLTGERHWNIVRNESFEEGDTEGSKMQKLPQNYFTRIAF